MERTLEHLSRRFETAYGLEPTGYVRAPGRVNLIGDHIDYNGLAVLPMAIQLEIRVAFRERADSKVRVATTTADHATREFAIEADIPPYAVGDWGNYVKAAVQTTANRYGCRTGFDALVESNIPPAAGLSSSSALVVAVAMTAIEVSAVSVPALRLATDVAEGERYVGTRGGGMDQAVSLMSRRGHASRIDFAPLAIQHIEVPGDWRVVVASSMVDAKKSGPAQAAYNERTVQCERARDIVATRTGNPEASYSSMLKEHSCQELLRIGSEVCEPLLERRFRHVVTEADRVGRAVGAMRCADASEFGRLMTGSHSSLRDDYEVSCDELDRMVEIALDSGAAGARLTGAGFGGCIVALATSATVNAVLEGLQERYEAPRPVGSPMGTPLAVTASSGASLQRLAGDP